MTQASRKNRKQIQIMRLDDMAPANHPARKLDGAPGWNFIYERVEKTYGEGSGQPSIEPAVRIKLSVILYMFDPRRIRRRCWK